MFLDKFKESPKDKLVILITIIGLAIVLLTYILIFIPIEASILLMQVILSSFLVY